MLIIGKLSNIILKYFLPNLKFLTFSVQNLLKKFNHLADNTDNFFEILEDKDKYILNAEKVLYDFDLLQEGEPSIINKNLESFKIDKNFNLFFTNLKEFCNFNSPFQEYKNQNMDNHKENLNELESKFSSDLKLISKQLENINCGHLDFGTLNKKIFYKKPSDDKNLNFNTISFFNDKEKIDNLDSINKNKTDKNSVISQQSLLNLNSTLNNNIATLQTDSSFLSANDENFKAIISNNNKGKYLCSYLLISYLFILMDFYIQFFI